MAFTNSIKTLSIVAATAFLVACGSQPASAGISTIEDYDAATQTERNEYVADALQRIHTYYRSNEETAHKAVCMEDLYSTRNASGSPRILTLILRELNIARSEDPQYKVEDVIFGVTERECADYPKQLQAARPTTQEPG